jgi:hypothetical protein
LPLFVAIVRVLPSIFWSVPRTLAGVSSANTLTPVATHATKATAIVENLTFGDM